ncbi:unnamed protein product [Ostreobium quekettii]|uniref:Tetratricopeptide repeat protein 8 n=1 Tax=Ostreobium quekettii TaxID=121088 RepID=A0A8S1J284_9CHLO|nr:unnamed protein product [Ostreobium quekettii]
MKGARPGTTRPLTSSGRFVRLGTASMRSEAGGPFINVHRLDLRKYASRPLLARALCDYILYHDHNPRKALELCSHATKIAGYTDWWWKARLGKCYYQLGMLRESESQFQSSLKHQDAVVTVMELCKVYLRMDQPGTAMETYTAHMKKHPGDVSLLLGAARVKEALNDAQGAFLLYKDVLKQEGSNVEAIACLASYNFYTDQPELALRFYRRLLQMGVNNAELWNNLGLCCFHASQYDMALSCFSNAMCVASNDALADVWFNVGHVAVGIGDLGMALQAFKVAVSVDSSHAEALNNLGVLECRSGDVRAGRASFSQAQRLSDHLFEAHFNGAVSAFRAGDLQESYDMVSRAAEVYPDHPDCKDLLKQLRTRLMLL